MISLNKSDIQNILQRNPSLKDKLYSWGFLFTDSAIDESDYPFYGNWITEELGQYKLIVYPNQTFYKCVQHDIFYLLIGHAYNPYSMCSDENAILKEMCRYGFNSVGFWDLLNQLTGIFTLICYVDGCLYLIGDATCMQTTFYSVKDSRTYISTHTNLIADYLDLKWSDYATELCNYKFFKLLGNAMPGDITTFDEVKRLVPNHYVCFTEDKVVTHHRFFAPRNHNLSVAEAAEKSSIVLKNNLQLISKKWNRASISMTGGCDSKTTLSCAKSVYDKFDYFSYISSESEKVDAEAAHQICKSMNLPHSIYRISESDSDFADIEDIRKILRWNSGDILDNNSNDVRKRAFFMNMNDFDIEIKSWASEIGRAYYSKRFNGRKSFGDKPTPRKCTTMYKFFLNNRKLVKQTDKVFEHYLNDYFEQASDSPVDWQDQFFWEYRVSSWNGLVITGEHRFSFDITIPYNNRLLLELLLSVPIEDRISDAVYKEIRKQQNPLVDKNGIAVINLKHTKNRERAENIYYSIHSKIHF